MTQYKRLIYLVSSERIMPKFLIVSNCSFFFFFFAHRVLPRHEWNQSFIPVFPLNNSINGASRKNFRVWNRFQPLDETSNCLREAALTSGGILADRRHCWSSVDQIWPWSIFNIYIYHYYDEEKNEKRKKVQLKRTISELFWKKLFNCPWSKLFFEW